MSHDSQPAQGAGQQVGDVLESEPDAGSSAGSGSELEALREESARHYAGWQRAQADFENLKRRSAQDVRDRVQQSQRGILLDLLDLADDFERANREAPANPDDPWRQGVELISQKLNALLLRQQVNQIDTRGQPFDPEYHEAVGQLPGPHNEIVAVLRTGYTVGERVLRATQVMVGDGSAAAPEHPAPTNESEDEPFE